jgi:hypothetical protein
VLVVKLSGLGWRRVCIGRRWKAVFAPCRVHWLELQPDGQDEAIVVEFEEVDSVIVREADGSIASPSQQMSL